MSSAPLVERDVAVLSPNPARVLARSFVPGQELLLDTRSRATGVLGRVLALPEAEVTARLRDVVARFSPRHRDFAAVLENNFAHIAHRVPADVQLTGDRRSLIGAWFSHEYAIEGAALFNPSAVPHPDQTGLAPGECRFVMSLRAVGEGHLSSIVFRTGVAGPGPSLRIDPIGPHVEMGAFTVGAHHRSLFAEKLAEGGANPEITAILLRSLASQFDRDALEEALASLFEVGHPRAGAARTAGLARRIAESSYVVEFPPECPLGERVLWPQSPSESHGLEDARFVRFADDNGAVNYRATYTAFDGTSIEPQLIETNDFRRFRMSQLAGPAAKNKGLALFPRMVGGRHLALSRWDRETISLASSADGRWWGDLRPVYAPRQAWELTQIGNCGSPVETDAGWLVLTHGVGPMREYAIGALLLDLNQPWNVIGTLPGPLLSPELSERDGYVPNVVYSCGPLKHGDQLLLPYGASDSCVRFAHVAIPELLARLLAGGPPPATAANSSA